MWWDRTWWRGSWANVVGKYRTDLPAGSHFADSFYWPIQHLRTKTETKNKNASWHLKKLALAPSCRGFRARKSTAGPRCGHLSSNVPLQFLIHEFSACSSPVGLKHSFFGLDTVSSESYRMSLRCLFIPYSKTWGSLFSHTVQCKQEKRLQTISYGNVFR